MRNPIQRIKNRLYGKFIIPKIEQTESYGDTDIHYLFYKKPSDTLVVVFQALPVTPNEFRYNYVTTLSKFGASQLFIQDDFAPHGNYYLGGNGTFQTEKYVFSLIDKKIQECNAKRVIFLGSSKGGYCAVNFGIEYPNAIIISGGPQYYIGDAMTYIKKFGNTVETIIGSPRTEEKIQKLNTRLRGKIKADKYAKTQTVYLHCSINDKTFERHAKDMLQDMRDAGINVHFDKAYYQKHDDLKYYFPDYINKTLKELKA